MSKNEVELLGGSINPRVLSSFDLFRIFAAM